MHEADVKNMVKDDHDDAFMVKVTVIDLDAKHLREHRNKYEQQLQQSQEAYRRWFRETDESWCAVSLTKKINDIQACMCNRKTL